MSVHIKSISGTRVSIMENRALRVFSLFYWLVASVFIINYGIVFCLTDILTMDRVYSVLSGLVTFSVGLYLYKSIIEKIGKIKNEDITVKEAHEISR